MARVFQELKRRNVFRVGVAYLVAAWLLLQVTDTLVPILSLPESASRFVFLLLLVGLVPALILAWAYELTPEGIKRERNVDRSGSITAVTGRKLDFAIIAMMAVAIVYLVVDNYVLDETVIVAESSIAVLPFRNRSSVAEDAFFVDGIHDDLLTRLSRLNSLDKVISRTSTERYRDTTKSIPEIGAELGVATILEGGVQRAGSQIRMNVQLIDTSTDEHLWAHTFDRELTTENLFEIQSEIARKIVAELHGVLSEQDDTVLRTIPTNSLDALTEYQLGRRELAKRTNESLTLAEESFKKAIGLDSNFALAYASLAETYSLQVNYANLDYGESAGLQRTAIEMALALDPNLGEAYAVLAMLERSERRREQAYENILKAIDLNPHFAPAFHWYSLLLEDDGQYDEQLTFIRRALELDPLSPILLVNLSDAYWNLGRAEESLQTLRNGIKRDRGFPNYHARLSSHLQSLGYIGQALQSQRAFVYLNPSNNRSIDRECRLYLDLGDDETAEQCLVSLQEMDPERVLFGVASLNFHRTEFDNALRQLEQYAEQQSTAGSKVNLAFNYILAGRNREGREILEESLPEFYADTQITNTPSQLFSVIMVARTLFVAGETERANYIFDAVLESMLSMHRTRGAAYGINDVIIHVTRGDRQLAVQSLRDAVDEGWRANWWILRAPIFSSVREDPEWLEIVDEIESDIARQRQWFEVHKDDPLL